MQLFLSCPCIYPSVVYCTLGLVWFEWITSKFVCDLIWWCWWSHIMWRRSRTDTSCSSPFSRIWLYDRSQPASVNMWIVLDWGVETVDSRCCSFVVEALDQFAYNWMLPTPLQLSADTMVSNRPLWLALSSLKKWMNSQFILLPPT